MSRVDVDQASVLRAVVEHLRSTLNLTDRQCFESINPMAPPLVPKGGDFFVTVSPGDGDFDNDLQQGGGQLQCCEHGSVIVTGYTRIKLDSTDHDEKFFRDAARGVLAIKKRILKAMVGQDTTNDDGNAFLRQLIFAKHSHAPDYDADKSIGWIMLEFGIDFDWDLS